VIGADAVDRVDGMGVDLILDERGRRGGAAVADLAGLEEAGAIHYRSAYSVDGPMLAR
jgi:hypothetical protein